MISKFHPMPLHSPVLAVLLLFFTNLFAGAEAHAQESQQIDAIFAEREKGEKPGCAVVIVKDGSVVYEKGYGMADLEHHVKITPQTAFDVASVAKQFTGLGVAMLIEQGKLKVTQDIRSILPRVPDFGRTITIDNLLHHTSGLRDWPEMLALSGVDWSSPISQDMIMEMVAHQRELDFLPGEEFQYSNTGYSLLGAAVSDDSRFTIEFTEGSDGTVSELRLSAGRIRNLRYTKTTLPVEP